MTPPRLVLASASPRRRELLAQLGVEFGVVSVDVEEIPLSGEDAEHYVRRVAAAKSAAGQAGDVAGMAVIAADTEVVLDGEIFGKPRDRSHAAAMLRRLSGRTHRVISAVSLRRGPDHWQSISDSNVSFRDLSEIEIDAYWNSGEPRDKAGAYAIQGRGAIFIRHLEGSYSGVMGLPLYQTARLLAEAGLAPAWLLGAGAGSP
ncbi:MAG: Maf family protein [Methylotetracoccus sp.]